jgi:protoporphyrinogen IX oxidase
MLLWLKAFHVIFVVTWFAGLFYLPRLFVYHVTASDTIGRARFVVMERRLFVMTTIGGALTVLFGMLMIMMAPG